MMMHETIIIIIAVANSLLSDVDVSDAASPDARRYSYINSISSCFVT